jgi:hypothetical protein
MIIAMEANWGKRVPNYGSSAHLRAVGTSLTRAGTVSLRSATCAGSVRRVAAAVGDAQIVTALHLAALDVQTNLTR